MSGRLWIGTRKGLFRIDRDSNGLWAIGATRFLGDPVTQILADTHGKGHAAAPESDEREIRLD